MNTQTNSENTSVKIPSLPSLFLHLYPSQTLHHSHTTPKRRFLSLSHRSFHSHSKPIRPANLIPFSESHSLFLPFRSPFHAHHSSHPFPASFSIPSDSSKSNPSITLKVISPSPHLHHPQPNPPFQPQINALPPWFPRLPPFVNSQLRTANPGVITLLDEFLF